MWTFSPWQTPAERPADIHHRHCDVDVIVNGEDHLNMAKGDKLTDTASKP